MVFVLLSVCVCACHREVFVALKGKCRVIYRSYVIDTTHLQYQLRTQEGDIAQT